MANSSKVRRRHMLRRVREWVMREEERVDPETEPSLLRALVQITAAIVYAQAVLDPEEIARETEDQT
jgi:hypothetical protein